MRNRMQKLIILTILFFSSNLMAWVSVGSSPGFGTCHYTTIQDAIDSGEGQIRVLNNQSFVENLTIDRSVEIKGGYTSCLTAQLNVTNGVNSIIKANNGPFMGIITDRPVIEIEPSIEALPVVKLYDLTLKDALEFMGSDGGRGIKIGDSNVYLELFRTLITNNHGSNGAGIYVGNPENTTVILEDSAIIDNTASMDGGGIFCSNTNTNIYIRNESMLSENIAENGGGIYATLGCHVIIDSGSDISEEQPFGIINNFASENGGGIYADLSAEIHLYGNKYAQGALGSSNSPVTLANNSATLNGGAIFANRNALINIEDGLITNNEAENGGAFYVLDTAILNVMRSQYSECWSSDGHCSIISHNRASLTGGGVYAKLAAKVDINRSRIFSNNADIGTFAYFTNSDTQLKLNNSFIYMNGSNGIDNDDYYVLVVDDSAIIEIKHSTIVDNDISDFAAILGMFNSSKISLHNSIVHNVDDVLVNISADENFLISCVVVNETNTVSGIGVDVYEPGFIDRINHDYHLSSVSAAIDSCDPLSQNLYTLLQDIDGELRPWDDNQIVNYLGIADAGADESYINDTIFKNSFE